MRTVPVAMVVREGRADDAGHGPKPRLLDPFGGPQDGFDPEFPPSNTGWEGVTTTYDPWTDVGPPPYDWNKSWDWPDDWKEHLAEWRGGGDRDRDVARGVTCGSSESDDG